MLSIDRKAIDAKGFYSIASSEDMTPVEVHDIYHLRDASEKQYMIMKSQLGFDVDRVHSDATVSWVDMRCVLPQQSSDMRS